MTTRLRAALARSRRRLRTFAAARDAMAAVEFALVLPVMVMMYFGVIAVTTGVNTDRKLTLVARTIADLTSRSQSTLSLADFGTIVEAAKAVLAPFNPSGMNIAVASIYVKNTGSSQNPNYVGSVCWSIAKRLNADGTQGAGTLPAGFVEKTAVTVPAGFQNDNSTYILTRVQQTYTPVVGQSIVDHIDLDESTPWPVRNVAEVVLQGKTACIK